MFRFLRRSAILIISFSLLFSTICSASSDTTSEVLPVFSDASAHSFLLMDGETGDVLSAKNADEKLPMASTTKIMTCVVALENAVVSDEVAIDSRAVGIEGSSVYLVKDEKLKLEELLYALMLESANDAACAIALHISDSISAFADLMNEKARSIGMESTNFVNPHGLSVDGHFSTARDLCKLMRYAMGNEAFRVITGTETISISAPNGKTRFLTNHNKLLRLYEECIGGKTGFTKKAGRCLVTSAKRGEKELICATLGDPDDWRDHRALFEYGFSLYCDRKIADVNQFRYEIPVVGGTMEKVFVSNADGFVRQLRSEEKIDFVVELPHFIYAPETKGDAVGEVIFKNGELEIGRISLFLETGVEKRQEKLSFWQKIMQKFKLWFD